MLVGMDSERFALCAHRRSESVVPWFRLHVSEQANVSMAITAWSAKAGAFRFGARERRRVQFRVSMIARQWPDPHQWAAQKRRVRAAAAFRSGL